MISIADAVSGRAGLEGLRWMLLSGAPRKVLRRELKGLVSAPNLLGPCHLRHASFRPSSRVKAYYDAYVGGGGAGRLAVRPIAVKWKLHGRASSAGLAEMQAEAVCQGVAIPFERLVADVPALCMRVQVSPLDAHFRQLVRLSNPVYVGQMIARVCGASETQAKQAPGSRYSVTHLRYWPGKRHVLRYDCVDGEEPKTFLAKLYRGETGREAFRVALEIGAWLAEHREDVTSVRPLAYLAEEGAVVFPKVFGTPLCKHLRRSGPVVARWLEGAGAALFALHQMPRVVSGPLELYDFAAEISETAKASSHVPVLLPPAGAAIQSLLNQAQELHEKLPLEPPCFAHGDYKSEHVWASRDGLTLIDLENCRWADPALDLGKFLADLRFWHAAYNQDGLEEAQQQFLGGYARPMSGERLARARLYEAVELIRMTVLRVALCDHGWASRTEQLVGRAQTVLNQVQGRIGLASKRHLTRSTPNSRRVPGAPRLGRGGRD